MAVNLSPVGGAAAQFFDNSGQVLTGGKLYTYLAGTTTPAPTFTSNSGITAQPNPIVLNAAGRVPDSGEIWLTDSISYKFVLKDQNDVQIASWDNVIGINSNFVNYALQDEVQTATQGQTLFTLTGIEYIPASNNLAVFVNGSRQINVINYVETSTSSVTFVNGLNEGDTVEFVTAIPVSTNAIYASNVSYTEGKTNSVAYSVQSRLQQFLVLTDFGAKCDGVTDDTAAINAAIFGISTSNVSLIIPGPTKFSSTLTFNPNTELVFQNGGCFIGTAGTELINVQRQPIAGPNLIFSNCAPTANTGMNCMPEWFGAKADNSTLSSTGIQKAITFLENVGGIVQFGSGTYIIDTVLVIGNNSSGGAGSKTVLNGVGSNVTILKTTVSDASAIEILGTSANPCRTVVVQNMSLTKSVTANGGVAIYAEQTRVLQIINVTISDYLYGVYLNSATNTRCEQIYVTFSGSASPWRGFYLLGSNTYGNASSYFNECFVDGSQATGANGIGFYSVGTIGADLVFFECETAGVPTGWYLDYTTSGVNGNEDVQLIQCRADAFKNNGIVIQGAGSSGSSDSMITIIGGWYNAKSTGATTCSVYMQNSRGVNISDVQFYNDSNYANGVHVYMDTCQNIIVTSCLFTGMKYGVQAMTSEFSMINGNRFWCQSGHGATDFIRGTGCIRVMANNNVFDGYAGRAVWFDTTSEGCGIVGNTANPNNIPTRFLNQSTGPVGGSDGSLGLNSGA